jgi:hypothetical protein
MTTATITGVAHRTRNGSSVPDRDLAIALEVRAELARQKPYGITQARVALEAFGESQQWFSRRLRLLPPFTPGELLALADYLRVDVIQFLAAGKNKPTGDSSTAPYVGPYLSLVAGDGEESDIAPADLRIAS